MAIMLLSQPLFIATLVANGIVNMAADLVYVVPPCRYPPIRAAVHGQLHAPCDDAGGTQQENCSEWFGWDGLFDENHTLATYDIDELDLTVPRTIRAVPGHDALPASARSTRRTTSPSAMSTRRTRRGREPDVPRQYFFATTRTPAAARSTTFTDVRRDHRRDGGLRPHLHDPDPAQGALQGEDVGGGIGDIAMGGSRFD